MSTAHDLHHPAGIVVWRDGVESTEQTRTSR